MIPDHLDRISGILAAAPAWARLTLTSAEEQLRARGANELSAFLLHRIAQSESNQDEDQLLLPLVG